MLLKINVGTVQSPVWQAIDSQDAATLGGKSYAQVIQDAKNEIVGGSGVITIETVEGLQVQLDAKAAQADLEALETELNDKIEANTTAIAAGVTATEKVAADLAAHVTEADTKFAKEEDLDARIQTKVDTGVQTAIDAVVDGADEAFNTLKEVQAILENDSTAGNLVNLESRVAVNETAIGELKTAGADVETRLVAVEANKAEKTEVTAALAEKATVSALEALQAQVAGKADAADVTAIADRVAAIETAATQQVQVAVTEPTTAPVGGLWLVGSAE